MSDILTSRYPEIAAGGFSRVDGTVSFYQRLNALLAPSMTVVDFGAGRGAFLDDPCEYRRNLRNLKGKARTVIGVDVDRAVLENRALDQSIVYEPGSKIPLPTGDADLIVSDFTFEHIEAPDLATMELDRILKPGGWLCVRTMNRYGYIAVLNRLIHSRWHPAIIARVQPNRQASDVFPAHYRLNTMAALARYFPKDRYRHCVYFWDSEPRYFGRSMALLRAFDVVHATTPSFLKTTIMIFLQKRAAPAS
jgi:SAM-dependent methyltransferase